MLKNFKMWEWSQKQIICIILNFGQDTFKGRKLLELGHINLMCKIAVEEKNILKI